MGWFLAAAVVAAELFHDGVVEAAVDIFRERRGLGIAINLDGFPRGVHDEPALLALAEVLLDFRAKGRVQFRVEVILEFNDEGLAIHC